MARIAREFPNEPERWGGERVCQACGETPCECLRPHWSITDDKAVNLPPHMQRWEDEARGD